MSGNLDVNGNLLAFTLLRSPTSQLIRLPKRYLGATRRGASSRRPLQVFTNLAQARTSVGPLGKRYRDFSNVHRVFLLANQLNSSGVHLKLILDSFSIHSEFIAVCFHYIRM